MSVAGLIRHLPGWSRRLFYGASVGAMANAAGQLGTFLFGIYLARYLGVADFGLWSIVYATLLTAIGLSSLSINVSAARFAAALGDRGENAPVDHLRVIHIINMVLAALVSLGTLAAADVLAARVLAHPEAATLIRWGCVFVFLSSVTNFWSGAIAGREAYPRLLATNLLGTATLLVVGVFATRAFGLVGGLGALALSAALVLMSNRRSGRRLIPALRDRSGGGLRSLPWRSVLQLAGPAAMSGLLTTAALWACQAALAQSAGGKIEVGLFAAANGLRSLAMLGLAFLTSAALVILSAEQARATPAEMRRISRQVHLCVAAVALAAGATLWLSGPLLLRIYGPDFVAARGVVNVLAAAVVVEAIGNSLYNELMIRGALVRNLWIAVIPREAVRIGVTLAWIDRGAIAVACAFLAAAAVFTTITALQRALLPPAATGPTGRS